MGLIPISKKFLLDNCEFKRPTDPRELCFFEIKNKSFFPREIFGNVVGYHHTYNNEDIKKAYELFTYKLPITYSGNEPISDEFIIDLFLDEIVNKFPTFNACIQILKTSSGTAFIGRVCTTYDINKFTQDLSNSPQVKRYIEKRINELWD